MRIYPLAMTCQQCFKRDAVYPASRCVVCLSKQAAERRFKSGEETQRRRICKRCKGEPTLPGSSLGSSCTRAESLEAEKKAGEPKRKVLETISDLDRKKQLHKKWKGTTDNDDNIN